MQASKDLSEAIKNLMVHNPYYHILTNKAGLDELAEIIKTGTKKLKQANISLSMEAAIPNALPPRVKEPIFNQPMGT